MEELEDKQFELVLNLQDETVTKDWSVTVWGTKGPVVAVLTDSDDGTDHFPYHGIYDHEPDENGQCLPFDFESENDDSVDDGEEQDTTPDDAEEQDDDTPDDAEDQDDTPDDAEEQDDTPDNSEEDNSESYWVEYTDADIRGFGYVHRISRNDLSIEDLQQMVVENGWSSFNYGARGVVYFKKFDY